MVDAMPTQRRDNYRILRSPFKETIAEQFKLGVHLLLKEGKDVRIKDKRENTPLHGAVYIKDLQLIRKLLNKGAEIDRKNVNGETPLHLAVGINYVPGVHLLLSWGADTNQKCVNGDGPFHWAVQIGNPEVVRALLNSGAQIESRNRWGETPLHIAAQYGHGEITLELLDRGAAVDAENNKGDTPLEDAKTEHVSFILQKHIVKLKTIKVLEAKKIPADFKRVNSFQTLCIEELQRMKNKKVGCLMLFSVLSNCNNPWFVQNECVENVIKSPSLRNDFPLYASILRLTFHKAVVRHGLLIKSLRYFNIPLPNELKRKILSFMKDEDLERIITVVEEDHTEQGGNFVRKALPNRKEWIKCFS